MVNITKFAVKRPVTIVLCLITIAYFGLQSLLGTKIELTPEMELPMLVVGTVYAGASPDDINDLITMKQEDAISSLDGVDTVQSFSQENVAVVLVQYKYGTNIDTAYINLKKAIDGIRSQMPDDIEEPNILEMDMNAQPVVTLAVSGQVDENLYTYVDNNIVPQFEKLSSGGRGVPVRRPGKLHPGGTDPGENGAVSSEHVRGGADRGSRGLHHTGRRRPRGPAGLGRQRGK